MKTAVKVVQAKSTIQLESLLPDTARLGQQSVQWNCELITALQTRLNSVEMEVHSANLACRLHKVNLHNFEVNNSDLSNRLETVLADRRKAQDRINEHQQQLVSLSEANRETMHDADLLEPLFSESSSTDKVPEPAPSCSSLPVPLFHLHAICQ